jgi:hypothetical protein
VSPSWDSAFSLAVSLLADPKSFRCHACKSAAKPPHQAFNPVELALVQYGPKEILMYRDNYSVREFGVLVRSTLPQVAYAPKTLLRCRRRPGPLGGLRGTCTMGLERAFCVLAMTFLPLLVSQSQVEYRTDWPLITNLDTTLTIDALSERIVYEIPMEDRFGKVIYTLFCRGGSTEYLDSLSDKTGINYVGPLCFYLVSGKDDSEGSLLCEDGAARWYSRGQLHDYRNLIGACGKYPEYGCLRHFRLRGFVLALHFMNIEVGKDGSPVKFQVRITVHRNKQITSSIAEQPGYLSPFKEGRSCETILRGNEPRMFRGENGSWFEEKELSKRKKR